MASIRAHVFGRLARGALAAVLLVVVVLARLAPAVRSGRVAPENRWAYFALSPDGSKAAVISSHTAPEASRNLWGGFGKCGGRLLPGPGADTGEIGVAARRILEQGGYSYERDSAGWSTSAVAVVDWSMRYLSQRAWA